MIPEKIPERLLAQYYQWLDENKHQDSLKTLKDWGSEEATYQIQATEIKNRISNPDHNEQLRNSKHRRPRRFSRSYFSDKNGRGNEKCCLCTGNHSLLKCEAFQKLLVDKRWQTVKQFGPCFRCLVDNHHGKSCSRSKPCGINRCKGTHQNLLDYDRAPPAQFHPRPEAELFVHTLTTPHQPTTNEKPWRGIVPGNLLLRKRLEIKGNQKWHCKQYRSP